ncbi:hypothetical protein [Klebsiella pneumoniae]
MKFFEYLAAGKNVVSVDLASIQEFSDYLKIAHSKEDFVNKIQEILAGDGFSVQHLHKLASEYTYKSRTDKMFELINTHLKKTN